MEPTTGVDPAVALPTFGYHPDRDEPNVALSRGKFARALVIDTPVRDIADHVAQVRVLRDPEVELHEGLYWFQGLDDGDLLVQFGGGALPGSSTSIALSDLVDDHPLASAWSWAEDLWCVASAIPAPKYAIHESLVTSGGALDVVVQDRQFVGASWMYTVIVDGHRQEMLEQTLLPRPIDGGPSSWVQSAPESAAAFSATLTRAKLQGKFANTVFSFRATRTMFRPYQFKPVLKLLQTGKARLLIADEVGLGKTIEAGLIWTELEARGEADAVLIVCPSSLVGKWREEMIERFGFEVTELDAAGLRQLLDRHLTNRLPPRHAYICSLERLRKWPGLAEITELPFAFDLVILDEAHSMRNADTRSFALGSLIADWADNLVFLTATPINLRETDLLHLLELLAPEDYGDYEDLMSRLEPNEIINSVAARLAKKNVSGRELLSQLSKLGGSPRGLAIQQRPDYLLLTELLDQDILEPRDVVTARRYLAELNTLSTVITRTRKIEVSESKAMRRELREEITWTKVESQFYDEYLKWCRSRAQHLRSPLYFAMQMPLRLASACLPMARLAVLDPKKFGDLRDEDDPSAPSSYLTPHPELVAAAEGLPEDMDTKFDKLLAALRSLNADRKRALLFTHSRPTLAYLHNRLGKEFRVAVMHGGVPRERRRSLMAEFRNGGFDFLLANRVASEGLDFEFCSAVINYDLPWNPMEVEQRIGRIDRIGQPEEVISVLNFINRETIDEGILSRLLERIGIFESAIGALEPIITSTAQEMMKTGFDFSLSDAERRQKKFEKLAAVEEQRQGLQDVSDASSSLLVSNDVDVAGLEDDLLRTGRYIGQQELAHLIADWTRLDGAPPPVFAKDGLTLAVRGNSRMASRVDELARLHRRTPHETRQIANALRSELPLTLMLDQEAARRGGGTILTATHPMAMAALAVPGYRQARFATVKVPARSEDSTPGTFVIVLAKLVSGSDAGDEIWGEAVDLSGKRAGSGPVNDLLSAVAEGAVQDLIPPVISSVSSIAKRGLDRLNLRYEREQEHRAAEFEAFKAARAVSLREQFERELTTRQRRLTTAKERGREASTIKGFETQIRRTKEKRQRALRENETRVAPDLRLEPLAACVVEVEGG